MEIRENDMMTDEARGIRTSVFVVEKDYRPEFDEWDEPGRATHLLAFGNGRAVATCRLYPDLDHADQPGRWVIGRLAVVADERGHGIGKTVLAETLASGPETGLIPEYGRDYDALFRRGSGWTQDDFIAIAEGHLALAGPIARASGPRLIEDTDPLQTLVWAEYLLGTAPAALVDLVARMARPDLYLLLGPETPWHDDGTRYSGDPARRRWFADRLAFWLDHFGARWQAVGGTDWDMRAQLAEAQFPQGHKGRNLSNPPREASRAMKEFKKLIEILDPNTLLGAVVIAGLLFASGLFLS